MLKACKMSGIRVFGAMRERRRREAARSLFINVRGKAEGASCMHERSRGLDERPNMSTEQRKAAKAAAAG